MPGNAAALVFFLFDLLHPGVRVALFVVM